MEEWNSETFFYFTRTIILSGRRPYRLEANWDEHLKFGIEKPKKL
jgi:hypothetical protein